MNISTESDINKTTVISKNHLFNFSNELNLNIASLTASSIYYDSFIQISPDDIILLL